MPWKGMNQAAARPDPTEIPFIKPNGQRISLLGLHCSCNEANEDSETRASQQHFVIKNLSEAENPGVSYHATLHHRIGDILDPGPNTLSVIDVTSGTNTFRAFLGGVRAVPLGGKGVEDANQVIFPQATVGTTVEAFNTECFKPVFVAVTRNRVSYRLGPRNAPSLTRHRP